ncbi:hypothetical protein QR97_18330 [Streptomyces sp. PBH53]|uniref:hypothetical protein n=1 Tax=Streptomyces sp. PBH53 TaxID=1577075 RepID=UPI000655C488|nr:hypothetical protein [Streptomyces sp. PBH53]AKN71501.1 hypothetical protein QR97_18330 [Streptomyces sp. PBH53]
MTAPENATPREEAGPWPAYALPPFHPGYHPGARGAPEAPVPTPAPPRRTAQPRRRLRRLTADGAAVSGLLAALCVAALLAAVGLAAVRTRC